jgi:hypothetical protein
MSDPVEHPAHYTDGPACPACGATIECITVAERMGFCLGNAVKYLWRAGKKDPTAELEDLKKARWYLDREIQKREAK